MLHPTSNQTVPEISLTTLLPHLAILCHTQMKDLAVTML